MDTGPLNIGSLVPAVKKPSGSDLRANEVAELIYGAQATGDDIGFLLSHHAHCYLPRRPIKEQLYEHRNGAFGLIAQSGTLYNPKTDRHEYQPIPNGGKARLLFAFLASYAKRYKTREIVLGRSFTDFCRSMAPTDASKATGGRNGSLTQWQKAFCSLAAAHLTVWARFDDQAASQERVHVADKVDLWFGQHSPGQRSLFPSAVTLGENYFNLVQNHAMPVDWRALRTLQGDPLALDIYCWMTWRLPRVTRRGGVFIPWPALKQQFGPGYARLRDFRRDFKRGVTKAAKLYPGGKIDVDEKGARIYSSKPAISPTRELLLPGAD